LSSAKENGMAINFDLRTNRREVIAGASAAAALAGTAPSVVLAQATPAAQPPAAASPPASAVVAARAVEKPAAPAPELP
jgi:ABC-type uncharacterized transport system substrate-binding protein